MHLWLAAILFSALPQIGPVSKKEAFLRDKHERNEVHLAKLTATAATPVLTMHNVWTNESLPVALTPSPTKNAPPIPKPAAPFNQLARDHYTNQSTTMDPRLFETVVRAAEKFHARYVEVVSGFRAPKYQLMLRKKGHEVARDSQHPRGTAVDFRVAGVPTKILLRFVRSLHLGGVGYYPESKFVHADVGPVRFWRGH
jgi:uncharacterized protein YcbK (DUF882 family)